MASKGCHAACSRNPARLLAGVGNFRPALWTTVLGLGALALLGASLAVVTLHVSTQTVLTGSMRGTFDPGALVLSRPVPVSDIRPGDVIVFTPPGDNATYMHRVHTVTGNPADPVITTKGDANSSPDTWKAKFTGTTVPKAFFSVPHLGRALHALHWKGLNTVLLVLLGTVVAVSGTRLILGSFGPRHSPRPA